MKVICQAYMALIVWAIGQYDKSDSHFRKHHLDVAMENAKLLQDYVLFNEMYLKEKERYKKEGAGRSSLLKAHRRFLTIRGRLHEFLQKHE